MLTDAGARGGRAGRGGDLQPVRKSVNLGRVPFDMLANAAYPRLAREYRKAFAQRLLQVQLLAAIATVLLLVLVLQFVGPWLLPSQWPMPANI